MINIVTYSDALDNKRLSLSYFLSKIINKYGLNIVYIKLDLYFINTMHSVIMKITHSLAIKDTIAIARGLYKVLDATLKS